MNTNVASQIRALIRRLPFPLILVGDRPGDAIASDRFTELFAAGSHDVQQLQRLVGVAQSNGKTVKLPRRDGRDIAARVMVIEVPGHGTLIAFEDESDRTLLNDNERLRRRIGELESVNVTDPLTGTWNRAQLDRMLSIEVGRAMRTGQPTTLILLDIDNFKGVNDTVGHLAGDAVLKEFVARVRQRMRATDSLFRWGGDEFVVLATSVGCRGGAVLAEALRRTVAAVPFPGVGHVTASLGVAEHADGESVERWLERTDQALYAAKLAGRDRIHVDRQGSSDAQLRNADASMLRLYWLEAYECGEPTIDAEHRQLFDLGNALIAAAVSQRGQPRGCRDALESMLEHLQRHFRDEEALLARCGYGALAEHRRAHAALVRRAKQLRDAAESGQATLGHLVNFLVNDVIALHLLKMDRDFYLELQRRHPGTLAFAAAETGAGSTRARSPSADAPSAPT